MVGNLEPLLGLVPIIVEAMVARKDRTFVEAADVGQCLPLLRAERQAFIKLLAHEAERKSSGKFSVREIPSSYFHGTKFRVAILHVVLCLTKYKRHEDRVVALPAGDEYVYAIVVSTNSRQGLSVVRIGLRKKKKR